ncbi:MAG TPA: iron chelate uptake ABC transporter family permease subunit [Phycisphaerae bacterium]|nr:iron chelate uptake ABC transporter family permease subunit [Phycisphaerae bacterium]
MILAAANERARTITDTGFEWPTWPAFWRTVSLADYNTRVVIIGTTLLGIAAGVVGTFAYLRKRAMVGDALSHATLPGIAAAFLITGAKSLPPLLIGAAISGVLGILCVLGLRRIPRIKEDAAIGIVLSVFFGAGIVLITFVQKMETGNQAGLDRFIYGKAAGMIFSDAALIGAVALAVLAGVLLMFKEFRAICFDAEYAAAQGWPVMLVDVIMMSLVVLTTVVGLQAVGLILVVALLIIPATAARFWTDDLRTMTLLAGFFGALSGWIGSSFSALLPRMPTGAVIVLCTGLIFFISMMFAPLRGVIASIVRRESLSLKIRYQNLLRAIAEVEEQAAPGISVPYAHLLAERSWKPRQIRGLIRRGFRRGDLHAGDAGGLALTSEGRERANRVLRNHRLWELYLIRYADIAPSHVDRDADMIEHVLSPEIIRELEKALAEAPPIPPSPHAGEVFA